MKIQVTFAFLVFAMAALSRGDDQALQRSVAIAVQRDQQALQSDPKNKEALSDIVDQLDGSGKWKDALPYLATLNEV